MRSWMITTVAACVLITIPSVALAQRRVPAKDSAAIGGDLGIFLPADDALNSGLDLEGFYEYYLTARNSVRFGLGWANPSFEGTSNDSLRYIRVPFDVVHNWEGGKIHPFVGGGLGIYFLQRKSNGTSIGDSDTKLGGTFFGGIEYFTTRRMSVKGEFRYHLVSDAGALNPDGAALTIGLKKYF